METRVTIYPNLTEVINGIYIPVENALLRIKKGKSKAKIEAIRACTDKEQRNKLKAALPGVLFSGVFTKRGNEFCAEQSKLICLDFDYCKDVQEQKKKLSEMPYVRAAWVSPSGNGVKALVKVSTTDHLAHFLALQNDFPEIDKSGKDVARLCFESCDSELYDNPNCTEYTKTYVEQRIETIDKKSPDYIFECLKAWLQKKGQAYVEGNRNNYVFALASACNRVGLGESDTETNILKYITGAEFQKEAKLIVRGVYKRYANEFSSREFIDNKIINKLSKLNNTETVFAFDDTSGDIISFSDIWKDFLTMYENGVDKGETTYFPEIDERFRWMRGQFNVLTGFGNFGKTNWFQQLALIKSIKDGTKWMFFSPEQMPPIFYFKDLIQTYYGRPIEKRYMDTVNRKEIEDVKDFIDKHFLLVYPTKKSPTPDYLMERFFEGVIKYNIDGFVIDPFNQMANNYKEFTRGDQYLERYLGKLKQFTKQNNVYLTVLTHPTNPPRPVPNEDMPAPDVWNISGGAMWNNIADNIICYHRPKHHIDKSNTSCQVRGNYIFKRRISSVHNFCYSTFATAWL